MTIASLELQLDLPGARSLKDKRRVVKSLVDRIRRSYHVAIAEVADHDLWGTATIGIACVSGSATHAESILQHVLDSIDSEPGFEATIIAKKIDVD